MINTKIECEKCGNKTYIPTGLLINEQLTTKDKEIERLKERNEIDAKAYAKYSASLERELTQERERREQLDKELLTSRRANKRYVMERIERKKRLASAERALKMIDTHADYFNGIEAAREHFEKYEDNNDN